MIQASNLTADQILGIPSWEPEWLFDPHLDQSKVIFHNLVARWHPDQCKDSLATDVFIKIKELFEEAKRHIASGNWQEPNTFSFNDVRGDQYKFRYRVKVVSPLGMGEVLIGQTKILYVLPEALEDLLDRGFRTLDRLKFPTPKIKAHFEKQIPQSIRRIPIPGKLVFLADRRPDSVRLRDLLEYFGGRLPPVHAAWLIGKLSDFACLLQHNGIAHANLSPETVFVVPGTHDIGVYDFWGFATHFGERFVALQKFAIDALPSAILRDKIADPRVDLELIKAIGREALGENSPAAILSDSKNPIRPMMAWLTAPAGKSAVDEYAAWEVAQDATFGPRKFHDLNVDFDQIYPERRL